MSSSNCCFLTCIQISQEAGQVVWYSHPFQNFPQFIVIHTAKGFGVVNKAEVDVFVELSCFFDDPADVGNLISGSSIFSKSSLNIWKFTVHELLKPGLENFEHYFASMWDEQQYVILLSILRSCFIERFSFVLLLLVRILKHWVSTAKWIRLSTCSLSLDLDHLWKALHHFTPSLAQSCSDFTRYQTTTKTTVPLPSYHRILLGQLERNCFLHCLIL